MSRRQSRVLFGLLAVVFSFVLPAGTARAAATAPRGLYRGEVLEARGRKPLEGALVLFTDKSSGVAYSAFSDQGGHYEIHLPRGTYTLIVMLEDKTYEPEETSRETPARWMITFAPAGAGSISDQSLELTSEKQEVIVRPGDRKAGRGARKTLLLEVVSPPPPNVSIQAIRTTPEREIHPRDTVEVTVEGTHSGVATVSMGETVSGLTLQEDRESPGIYRGRIEVPEDYEGVYLVSATITTEDAGETTLNGPQLRIVRPQPAAVPVISSPGEIPPEAPAAPATLPEQEAPEGSTQPPPAEPRAQPPAGLRVLPPVETIDPAALTASLSPAYFEFDRSDIREDAGAALTAAAGLLDAKKVLQAPDLRLRIEGHCDEVGSDDYNDRLGLQRAESARNLLVLEGLPGDRIATVSYGRRCPLQRSGAPSEPNRRVKLRLLRISDADASRPVDTTVCPVD
jgi:peptidoglycan-associated lipoprotein